MITTKQKPIVNTEKIEKRIYLCTIENYELTKKERRIKGVTKGRKQTTKWE